MSLLFVKFSFIDFSYDSNKFQFVYYNFHRILSSFPHYIYKEVIPFELFTDSSNKIHCIFYIIFLQTRKIQLINSKQIKFIKKKNNVNAHQTQFNEKSLKRIGYVSNLISRRFAENRGASPFINIIPLAVSIDVA